MKNEFQKKFINAINGDMEAFSQIYEDMKKPVFTIIFRIVKNYHLAEEVMQELFIKLFTNSIKSSVKNPRAYIFQMARNLSIDALRNAENRKHENIDDKELSTDGSLNEIIFNMDLEKALCSLEETEKEILFLHIMGELTFFEISKITNMSMPSVYRRYCKAIKTLRDELNGGYL